ncbi:hypothetical protein HMPREF1155_0568 [Slackia sp. CM382]|nr:hypothetical protein HMPREF1155_0568 [Slackia sp. CM382]
MRCAYDGRSSLNEPIGRDSVGSESSASCCSHALGRSLQDLSSPVAGSSRCHSGVLAILLPD